MKELSFSFGTTVVFAVSPALEMMGEREILVFDTTTRRLFGSHLNDSQCLDMPPGEPAKGWHSIESTIDLALEKGLGRDDWITGVGGGVVTDVAAFAASVYLRGCRLRLVPTTLLAMVDAALGGKTAINFRGYKNMVGTFYPAHRMEIRVGALESLSDREYASGMAEVIKTALLGDTDLYALLVKRRASLTGRDPETLEETVRRCLEVKGGIVEQDITESGVRAHLNLGHTFAHAMESVAGIGRLSHGEAVAWGTARALDLGLRLGITPGEYRDDVVHLLRTYGYELNLPVADPDALLQAMGRDKKRQKGRMRFVLQRNLHDTIVCSDVDSAAVRLTLVQQL